MILTGAEMKALEERAFAAGASAEVLKQSTRRLTKVAAGKPQPQSARAQGIAFPTVARDKARKLGLKIERRR